MTTEAKLKKLEEDQIIMEDQNCKLAKVRPGALRRTGCGECAAGRRPGAGPTASPSLLQSWHLQGHGPLLGVPGLRVPVSYSKGCFSLLSGAQGQGLAFLFGKALCKPPIPETCS